MKTFVMKLFNRAENLAQTEPVLALFIGGALLALFLSAFFNSLRNSKPTEEHSATLVSHLYGQAKALVWAGMLVALTATALSLLRGYLHQTLAAFQRSHGRITQANYNASDLYRLAT
jgi:hypothetical protein